MPPDCQVYNPIFLALMGIELPLGITANVACITYIVFKLKLNTTIKQILLLDTSIILSCFICTSVGYICLLTLGLRTPLLCSAFLLPITLAFTSSSLITCILSYVRYNMAYRASQGEIYDNPRLTMRLGAFGLALALYHIATFLASAFFEAGVAKAVTLCYGGTGGVYGYINFVLIILGFWSTIFYDVAMVKFLRERSRTQPLPLAVWTAIPQRTSSTEQRDLLRDSVPIKSTIFIIFGILFISVATVALLLLDPTNEHGINQFVIAIGTAITGSHMVFSLMFTIKSQDEKTQPLVPAPPSTLQYHDKSESH